VKNITGHYRRLLDAILDGRSDLASASSGATKLLFTPDPDKTFHRGATDYFANGRQIDIGAFDAPSFVGLPLGAVTKIGPDWFEIETDATLANGDGLNYLHKRETRGIRANSVKQMSKVWRVWPNEKIPELTGLRVGLDINRNSDHAWELTLNKKSAERKIGVAATFSETSEGYALTLRDEDGVTANATAAFERQPAKNPAEAEDAVRTQLARLGNTDFELDTIAVEWSQPLFAPNSLLNQLRRDAVERLEAARLAAHVPPRRKPAVEPTAMYPEESLSYLANVYNSAAQRFYTRHGVKLIEAAYEAHQEEGEVSLMITRHCIRYSLSLCPKQAKGVIGVQGQVRAEPMTLVNGSEKLRLEFDCRKCEMHVIGKAKKHILKSLPPSAVPVTFHPRG
jgi:putative protease